MNIFLRLKHWQLFGALMGIPFILQIIGFTLQNPIMISTIFPLVMILFMGIFFGWFYALAVNLNPKLPDTVKMNLTKFKWVIFIPTLYMLLVAIFMSEIFENREPSPTIIAGSLAVIFPLHLLSIFCIFYCLYFVAKSLKAVEWQRPVTFNDYAGEFFLIWFFPLGVWFIQPRINKMFDETIKNE